MLDYLHQLRECRNVNVKTCLNLRRLQHSNFCSDFFSIIVLDDSRRGVACLIKLRVTEVFTLVKRLESSLRGWAEITRLNKPYNILAPEISNVIQPSYFEKWSQKLMLPSFDRSEKSFITRLQLIVHILDLGVVSFAGAHVRNFVQTYSLRDESKIDLLEPFSGAVEHFSDSVVLRRCSLQCLHDFHGGAPVWVFAPKSWLYQRPLCLSTDMQIFADIWGPLWKKLDSNNPNTFTGYAVGNGAIIPWRRTNSEPAMKEGEIFCHWIPDENQETDMSDALSLLRFDGAEQLLMEPKRLTSDQRFFRSTRSVRSLLAQHGIT